MCLVAINLGELQTHMENNHVILKLTCECCNYETECQENLHAHKQVEHKTLKVDIKAKDQVDILCDQCEFKSRLNIQMKKHKKSSHNLDVLTPKVLSCSYCEFNASDEASLNTHVITQHEDSAIITIVGNQQIFLLDAMESLKHDMNVTLNTIIDGQKYMKNKMLVLEDEIAMLRSEKVK